MRILGRVVWGLLPLGTSLLGFLSVRRRTREHNSRKALALEFYKRLGQYVQSKGQDHESYLWLVQHSQRMQTQVGLDGVFATYKPPGANYYMRNYAIILNLLPELKNELTSFHLGWESLSSQYASILQDALVRHFGTLDQEREELAKLAHNPIEWLREGTLAFLGFPVRLLGWVGLLSTGIVHRGLGSSFARILSGLATLAMLLSAIIGIVVGWQPFIQFFTALFK